MFGAGYYNWIRRDRRTERELTQSKGVRNDTWRTHKNLFVGADALLSRAKSLVNESRAFHYDHTLPWQHKHTAVIANALVPTYRQKLAEFQNSMDMINDQLKDEWKGMMADAKRILGPAYNSSDYPDLSTVTSSNYIRAKFAPVASGDDIRSTLNGATDEALDAIRQEINADALAAHNAAMRALWERLYKVIMAANNNLKKSNSDDGRFRTEWYDNLQSLLSVLPSLNIGDDSRLDMLKEEAEELLRYEPEDLKDDLHTRREVAKEADAIFKKMAGMFSPKESK
jgi:hypothetical protein